MTAPLPIRPVDATSPADAVRRPVPPAPPRAGVSAPAFDDVLGRATRGANALQFSGHALQRLERRGIDVGQPVLERLQSGVDRAAAKGSRESVVFVDGTAFVVSIRNKTVITAVDREHMRDHVFTNIDSVVLA